MTAAAPVLAGAAASSATAKLAGWELRQLASSPLSAQARRLKTDVRELAAANGAGATTPARQQGVMDTGELAMDAVAAHNALLALYPAANGARK
jgi:hypothetical protein